MKELMKFTNESFGEIRGCLINNEPWLVGKDVVEKLGYDIDKVSYSKYIKKNCNEEDYVLLNKENYKYYNIDYKLLGQRGGYIINENGLIKLIEGTEILSNIEKENILNFMIDLGIINNKYNILVKQRKEIGFLTTLEESLTPFRINGVRQYSILNYRIDYYIPSLNIAIEYDENCHKNYSYENQELRQKKLEDKLGCKFIRVSDKNSDAYNIGFVINEILKQYKISLQ